MAALTLSSVARATICGRFKTLETVLMDTPACAATSLMLADTISPDAPRHSSHRERIEQMLPTRLD
jgi:hypothetical protein